jgi:D-glycero-alpha-D-manno-heptose 1-phosphate guanylyltransferase
MVEYKEQFVRTVLLAGGFGTRVAHLLPNMPKPMASIAGRPFVEWVIRYFAHCGLGHFILSTGHLAEVIETYFLENPIKGVDEVCCRKETSPQGTAGGFLHATEHFAEPAGGWLVTNADSLVVSNPMAFIHAANKNGWTAAILGLEVADASRFGSLRVADDGTLLAFAEKCPGAGLINAGVYWFAPGCRPGFPTKRPLSFEMDVFPDLIAAGARIGVVPVTASFIDIGTPASLAEADAFVRAHFELNIC